MEKRTDLYVSSFVFGDITLPGFLAAIVDLIAVVCQPFSKPGCMIVAFRWLGITRQGLLLWHFETDLPKVRHTLHLFQTQEVRATIADLCGSQMKDARTTESAVIYRTVHNITIQILLHHDSPLLHAHEMNVKEQLQCDCIASHTAVKSTSLPNTVRLSALCTAGIAAPDIVQVSQVIDKHVCTAAAHEDSAHLLLDELPPVLPRAHLFSGVRKPIFTAQIV